MADGNFFTFRPILTQNFLQITKNDAVGIIGFYPDGMLRADGIIYSSTEVKTNNYALNDVGAKVYDLMNNGPKHKVFYRRVESFPSNTETQVAFDCSELINENIEACIPYVYNNGWVPITTKIRSINNSTLGVMVSCYNLGNSDGGSGFVYLAVLYR